MAEEEIEMVEVDLNAINMEEVETAYTEVAEVFRRLNWSNDAEGFTRVALVFLCFIRRWGFHLPTCGICVAGEALHLLAERFVTDAPRPHSKDLH